VAPMSLARVLVSIGGKIGPLNFISFNRTDS
jgi:hypothetical protein